MKTINKYEKQLINHYAGYEEDMRFNKQSHQVEFLTTMHYIQKYLKPNAKILEIGAGTGAYSIPLAKQGYEVTAVDLLEKHVTILKQKTKRIKNITCLQADALDLSQFSNNSFDIVLNLGPMYHLFTKKDRLKAINESLRVCKSGGICMFAYISGFAVVWEFAVRTNNMAEIAPYLTPKGKLLDNPKNGFMFASYTVQEFADLFKQTNTTPLKTVAADSVAPAMCDYVNNLSKKDFNTLLNWHLTVCDRPEMLGTSCHQLYICKKNKEKLCNKK